MSRWRALIAVIALALVAGLGSMFGYAVAGPPERVGLARTKAVPERSRFLEIYYSSPMLVRAGEAVRMPVDVVCATAQGHPCSATVTLGTQVPGEPWQLHSAPAGAGLEFDLTAPAARATTRTAGWSVRFFLRARDEAGRTVWLPPAGPRKPLRFFVTRSLRTFHMPRIAFGAVERGTAELLLPWGSGPGRAGLELGRESATRGPSGFDVDRRGHILLLDTLQRRVAVFDRRRLIASDAISAGVHAVLAAGAEGRVLVAGRTGDSAALRRLERAGRWAAVGLGPGIPVQARVIAGRAFVRTLPLDAWVSSAAGPALVGMPLADDGELVRVGREDRLRIGRVAAGQIDGALELLAPSGTRLGEIALTEVDRHGGYWVVVRVSRDGPSPADQFEVLHLGDRGVTAAFAVDSHAFADAPPLSRFVLGRDGALYQMTSSPAGMRVVRYELKGGER